MLVADFDIIITKQFTAALVLSPFGFYGDILKLVYTTCSAPRTESMLYVLKLSLTECDLQINMCRIPVDNNGNYVLLTLCIKVYIFSSSNVSMFLYGIWFLKIITHPDSDSE